MSELGPVTTVSGAAPAVLVVRGDRRRVTAWVERGTVPSYVVDLPGRWCAVVPAGPGQVGGAYADPALMTAARPTPMSLRPSLTFLTEGPRAVCVLQQRRWRALPRWFVVEPGVGAVRAELPQASRADVLAAVPRPDAAAFDAAVTRPDGSPREILRRMMTALAVPAEHLLDEDDAQEVDGVLVEPSRSAVRRFAKNVGEEAQERQEIEEMDQ